MPAKLRFTVETQKRNARMTQYDADKVFEPFEEPITIVERFQQQHAAIASNAHLTPQAVVKRVSRSRRNPGRKSTCAVWLGATNSEPSVGESGADSGGSYGPRRRSAGGLAEVRLIRSNRALLGPTRSNEFPNESPNVHDFVGPQSLLKSWVPQGTCGFDPRPRHHQHRRVTAKPHARIRSRSHGPWPNPLSGRIPRGVDCPHARERRSRYDCHVRDGNRGIFRTWRIGGDWYLCVGASRVSGHVQRVVRPYRTRSSRIEGVRVRSSPGTRGVASNAPEGCRANTTSVSRCPRARARSHNNRTPPSDLASRQLSPYIHTQPQHDLPNAQAQEQKGSGT